MQYGCELAAKAFGPKELVRQAQLAEASGFDLVEISDHCHPWLDSQGRSTFAWTVLGTIASSTESIGWRPGVTCPTVRYHPAIIAQAAATLAIPSDGRFTLRGGSGERLNEHVVGRGFPAVAERRDMLREARMPASSTVPNMGWNVLSELPNPPNFAAAPLAVRKEDIVLHAPMGGAGFVPRRPSASGRGPISRPAGAPR